MHGFSPSARSRRRFASRVFLLSCLAVMLAAALPAQSTFSAIIGIVRDASGALVQGAQVTLLNTGTTAAHTAVTDAGGNYAFKNVDVGSYKLVFAAPGHETAA